MSRDVPTLLLNTEEAAQAVALAPRTLIEYRLKGGGPPYCKLGRAVRYRPSDLAEWLAARVRRSTSDPGGLEAA
jgi:predicted DNA-binding transcriptional regulator AlpA